MRVLHIVEASLGGVRRYLENIVEAVDGLEIESGVAYSRLRADVQFDDFLKQCSKADWKSFDVAMVRSIHPSRDVRAWWRLTRLIRDFKPGVIHCHSSKAGALGRMAAWISGHRMTVYSPHAIAANLHPSLAMIERMLRTLTKRYIAVSQSERHEIARVCRVDPARISVVSPSIDVDYYHPRCRAAARREIRRDSSGGIVVGLGRLCHQKDPVTFVRIIERLVRDGMDVHGIWVGQGELGAEVERMVAKSGLASHFHVVAWQRDVRPYIAAADVVLVTSRYESFGYVTAEALAMARPVVATNVVGTIDIIIDGKWGHLFAAEDSESGARAVRQLLRSPAEAEEMGMAGREFVGQRFTTHRMRRDLSDAYAVSSRW